MKTSQPEAEGTAAVAPRALTRPEDDAVPKRAVARTASRSGCVGPPRPANPPFLCRGREFFHRWGGRGGGAKMVTSCRAGRTGPIWGLGTLALPLCPLRPRRVTQPSRSAGIWAGACREDPKLGSLRRSTGAGRAASAREGLRGVSCPHGTRAHALPWELFSSQSLLFCAAGSRL